MIRKIRRRNESLRHYLKEGVSYGRFLPRDLKAIKRDIDKLNSLYRDDPNYIINDGNVNDLDYTINTFLKYGEVEDGDDSVYKDDDDFVDVLSYSLNKLRERCEKTLALCDSIENKIN